MNHYHNVYDGLRSCFFLVFICQTEKAKGLFNNIKFMALNKQHTHTHTHRLDEENELCAAEYCLDSTKVNNSLLYVRIWGEF